MHLFHTCASRNDLETAAEHAPSFEHGVGWVPNKVCRHDWAYFLDNGCYKAWRENREWTGDAFRERLGGLGEMPRPPEFVVLPDVPRDARRSLERSEQWVDVVQEHGYDYYLPVQDGMSPGRAVQEAGRLGASGLFIAGSARYKWEYAHLLVDLSHEHGLNAHIGNPGEAGTDGSTKGVAPSAQSLTWARDTGADSVDSSSIVRNGYWGRLRSLEASAKTEQRRLTP